MQKVTISVLASALFLSACATEGPPPEAAKPLEAAKPAEAVAPAAAGLPDRDIPLAKKLIAEGAVLLDVRTKEEFDAKHLDKAENISIQELDARMADVEKLTGGDKTKPIVLYCGSGKRAGTAKEKLVKAGYTQVTNAGGIGDFDK